MRNIFLLFILLATFTANAQKAVISGKITKPNDEKVLVWYNKGAAVYGFNEIKKEAVLDKKDRFRIELPLDAAAEVTLQHGNEVTQMFLEPGDEVAINLHTEKFDESIRYEGKNAANNNFIAKYFLAFLDGGQEDARAIYIRKANMSAADYFTYLDSLQAAKLKFYEQNKSGLSLAFQNYFTTQLAYETANEKFNYPLIRQYYAGKEADLPADYYYFLEKIRVQNDSALMSSQYLDFADNFLMYQVRRLSKESQNKEFSFSQAKYQLAKVLYSGKLRDVMLAEVVMEALDYVSFKEAEPVFMDFKSVVKNTDLQQYVSRKYEKKKLLADGAPAPVFTLKDTSGKSVSLEDFKGKIVYLDFWASWCGPCMQEAPHAVKLQEKFAGKDVVFLYVSTDENDEAWKKAISSKNLQKGVHLISKKSAENVQEKYDVNGIPSYFLIGRDGKIINGNASRPSQETTVQMLNDALARQ